MTTYYLLIGLPILVQVLLIIHCVKSGRNTIWVWVLAFTSYVGILAYVAVEIAPPLLRSRATRRAVRGLSRVVDPGQDLRRLELQASGGHDVASRQRLADALSAEGQFERAIGIYQQALSGLYEFDPNLLLGRAGAEFGLARYAQARATLDTLIQHNPQFKSPDGHLLYARALEGEGALARAESEYAGLAGYYAGAEARLRYAQLLKRRGRPDAARAVLGELLQQARLAPRHYQRMQRHWLSEAERELAGL